MTKEEHLGLVLAQITRAKFPPAEPQEPPLLERMRAQLIVWEDNEPDEAKWPVERREYGEAFLELEQYEALQRYLASRPVPSMVGDDAF